MKGVGRSGALPCRDRIEVLEQRENLLRLVGGEAQGYGLGRGKRVRWGALPAGGVAAVKSLSHAWAVTRVARPDRTLASVAKLASVGV